MEKVKNEAMQNVIILDKSGGMESIRQAVVRGFYETLNGIKKMQEKYADTQGHLMPVVPLWQTIHSTKRVRFD